MLPRSITVYLTNYCELKCSHCFLKEQLNTNYISYSKMVDMIQDFKNNKVFIVAYTGGDPLLHENIFDILKETYNNGILPLLGISGMNVTDEVSKKIKECNVGCVQISLDGSSEKINSIYRGKDNFNNIINSIKSLRKYDNKVNLAICISQENFHDFKNIIHLAKMLKIYKLKVAFWKNYNDNNLFNELTNYQKKEIKSFCDNFEDDNWIMYPSDSEKELVSMHNSNIIIDALGNIKHTEDGIILGNINENLPSFYFK